MKSLLFISILFFSLTISMKYHAQKNAKTETIEWKTNFKGSVYVGAYSGSTKKQKKEKLPNGFGKFKGYKENAGIKKTLLSETSNFSSNSSNSIKVFNVANDPNTDFHVATSISMTRADGNTGGANLILFFNNSSKLEIKFYEFEKETYNPQTATILEKTTYATRKTAFKNIQITGNLNGTSIEEKMKPFNLDYNNPNKLNVIKTGGTLEIYVNDNSEGSFSFPEGLSINKISLEKDQTHSVTYHGFVFNQTKYNEDDKLEYSGNWVDGFFNGSGTLNVWGLEIMGDFINGELNGAGKATSSGWNYYGPFVNTVPEGDGHIVSKEYEYRGQVKDWDPNGTGKMWINGNSIQEGTWGKIVKPNPEFEGTFKKGKPEGSGKLTYVNGEVLTGDWNGFLFTGKGKLTLKGGIIYEGDWKNGKKEGKGKLTYSDGNILEGDFINDKFNGKGKMVMSDGSVFEGTIVMGNPSGEGTAIYPNGDRLTGTWNEFGFNGKGKRNYEEIPNEQGKFCFEEGTWVNGKLQGMGKKVYQFKINPDDTWQTVATYTGEFYNGLFQGKGILDYNNGVSDLLVDATWQNGQSTNGKVTYTEWGDESKYVSYYTGELTGLGIANGTGTYKSSEGSVYVGQMKNGVPHGQGSLTLSNGTKQTGEFVNGEYKKPFQCKTATIGNQVWMAENLNLTTFRNGDQIPEARTAREWEIASENKRPAFCYVNNDPSNASKYGILYNWYAVNDKRGLAPEGWRIPSENDYRSLKLFSENELNAIRKQIEDLDRQGVNSLDLKRKLSTMQKSIKTKENMSTMSPYWGGTKLKSKTGWRVDKFYKWNGNGTDIYGFNAKSSFERRDYGEFADVHNATFWTSGDYKATAITLKDGFGSSEEDNFKFDTNTRGFGYNVRCIKQ